MKAQEIAQKTQVKISKETQKIIDSLLESERLAFDEKEEKFTYRLLRPLTLEDGGRIELLTIAESTGADIASVTADMATETVLAMQQIIAIQNNYPTEIIKRIKQRDYTMLSILLGFFASPLL